jgi:hypothetical protein
MDGLVVGLDHVQIAISRGGDAALLQQRKS